jgi:hypothetical protein
MKLSDLLDTRPFNVLTVALTLFLLTSSVFVPFASGGKWRIIESKLNDITSSIPWEAISSENSIEALQVIDYSAMQTVPILFE